MKPEEISAGIHYLRTRDPVLATVIERVGEFALTSEPDIFKSLVRAILSQQISTSAAQSIYKRVIELVGGESQLLTGLAKATDEQLRTAGVSPQKARYLRDLAVKVVDGTVLLKGINERTNSEIIAELTQVKGIGVWTVQMLLIFSLGRLDVFPGDDLGIRTAIKRLYRKRLLPTKPHQLQSYAKLWQPYASIASWYCWRSLEFSDERGSASKTRRKKSPLKRKTLPTDSRKKRVRKR